jgi:Spy/CpxP family protein refolding chaperone
MTNTTSLSKYLAITIVAGLLGIAHYASAQPRWGSEGHMGRNHRHGLERLLMNAKEIGLSDAQVGKLKELEFAAEKERIDLDASLEKAHLELRELMSNSNPDENKIGQQVKKIGERRTNMMLAAVEKMLKVRRILTDEQKQKMKEHMNSRFKERGRDFRNGRRSFGANAEPPDDEYSFGGIYR